MSPWWTPSDRLQRARGSVLLRGVCVVVRRGGPRPWVPATPDRPPQESSMQLSRAIITRQHVMDLLPLMRLSPAQEARLLSLRYPVEFAVAAAAFESVG